MVFRFPFLAAECNPVPGSFMAEIDGELDCCISQTDGGGKLSLSGQKVDEGSGYQGGDDAPRDRFGKTSSRCFH